VRERVITAEHDVKGVDYLRLEGPKIGHIERQCGPERRGFPGSTRDGRGAEVCGMDGIAAHRQADGLRADPAGTVEHRTGHRPHLTTDQEVERLALSDDLCSPIGKHKVVFVC
jgi:hypothetical protein